MAPKLLARLILDFAMTILILFAMAYRITGDVAHEWIGIAVTLLFIVHNAINWRWYRVLFKGKYDVKRAINTLVNLLLFVAMTVLVISGVMLSRTVFSFMGFDSGMQIRQIHTSTAYWGLILVAVHIGMHWEMIVAAMRRMMKITEPSRLRTIMLRIVTALIFVYGVYASFDREMGAKLFLGYSFDFWNPDRPAVFFFTSNLAIMEIYICLTYYALKWLAHRRKLTGEI
jgi:hypothetical protein